MSSYDSPRFVVPDETLVPLHTYPSHQAEIPPSRMFVIKLSLATYREKMGQDAVVFDASQGDGGASLPGVPEALLDRAHEIVKAHGTSYDFPYGSDEFRRATAEDYWRLESTLGWGPHNVLCTVGGRDGLVKAYGAMIQLGSGRVGDVLLLTRVPWVSYNWGPYAVGANVMLAPGDETTAWQFTPETIRASVEYARARGGRRIIGIVITSPDNPTGRVIPAAQQIALGKAALEAGISYVVYDWIYHYVTEGAPMDANAILGAFSPEERARIIILDGLTKSLGASNVRNAHLLADRKLIDFMSGRASHSVVPHFHGQAVALAAYEQGFAHAAQPIIGPTNASRRVMRDFLTQHGYQFILGDGGYYAFINVGRWMDAGGFANSFEIGAYLAEAHGIAVVPGGAFSDEGDRWIRFSYALPPQVTQGAVARFHQGLSSL